MQRISNHMTHTHDVQLNNAWACTCLFFQLPHSSLCRVLPFIYQASWHLQFTPECCTSDMLSDFERLQSFDNSHVDYLHNHCILGWSVLCFKNDLERL